LFFVPKLVPYTNGRLMTDKNIQIIITLCAWCDSEMSKRSHEVEMLVHKEEVKEPLVSHGICPDCYDVVQEGLDEI